MAWDVPKFSTGSSDHAQAIQQAFGKGGAPAGGQQPQGRPVAASSTDMAGNTAATAGTAPQPMFRPGSPLGTFFPDAQAPGSMDWSAAISRLMGLGV